MGSSPVVSAPDAAARAAALVRPEISAMAGYVPGEQPQGGKFIKLNTNENPYPCSPNVRLAIMAALDRGLQKYPDPTATAFRQRAGEVLGVPADWLMAGNGSDDILTIVTRAFVGEGQRLRLPYPSYILYRTLAQLQGADAEEIRFTPDFALPQAFGEGDSNLKLVFLPNPNSPSGTVVSPDAILAFAESLPCPLVVDEAYGDFAETNCLDLVKRSDKILVSRTLSKSYALAGLRFGFVVGQPHVIEQLHKVRDSYNVDSLAIAGATAAIDDQAWLRENTAKIKKTRAALFAGLTELGFAAVPSQANFVWAPHPSKPCKPMYEELKANRVLVRYMHYAGWGDGLRISVGTDDQIEVCLSLLKGML
ncbi:MAG TPA: histidinol-phosphate transaminase [Pirellulales bacterium]